MSGMWNPAGRPRKVKQPVVVGHTIETRKGGLYVVPKNRKGKSLWDMAKYIGPVPEVPLDADQLPVMSDIEPEYAETEEVSVKE